jgi:hypothetical protein
MLQQNKNGANSFKRRRMNQVAKYAAGCSRPTICSVSLTLSTYFTRRTASIIKPPVYTIAHVARP